MKKILLFILFFGMLKSFAQVTLRQVDTFHMSTTTYVDSAFGMLDTTRISTKYLLDRAIGNFGANKFNGTVDSLDTIKSSFKFYQVYASIYGAQVNRHPHFTEPLAFG